MLPIDVTFDTGEDTERGWTQKKNIVKDRITALLDLQLGHLNFLFKLYTSNKRRSQVKYSL